LESRKKFSKKSFIFNRQKSKIAVKRMKEERGVVIYSGRDSVNEGEKYLYVWGDTVGESHYVMQIIETRTRGGGEKSLSKLITPGIPKTFVN